jgi:transcriptional regulator with XRE-family HTH domain
MTQASLAESLGVPQSYVSKLESGERRIDFVETLEICEALGVSVGDLVARMGATAKGHKIAKRKGGAQ